MQLFCDFNGFSTALGILKDDFRGKKQHKRARTPYRCRMGHGLDAGVSIPRAAAALHCSPAPVARCNRTMMPAPLHVRDVPVHTPVPPCQGPRTVQLLHCLGR